MDAEIDANAPLDFVEFHIFPGQNRYEAFACYVDKTENVTSGLLENLLVHSPEVKALQSKGSNATYKLNSPENDDIKWFTKSIVIRFLHIIDSKNVLDIANSVKNEISQLEDARRFHLSLYAKGTESQSNTVESGNSYTNGTGSTQKDEGLDASKNELLRAMDSRLTALRGELTAAFDQAAGSRYSVEEMTDIEKFSHYFGSLDLRDSLCKYIELRQGNQAIDHSSSKQIVENDGETEGCNHTMKPLSSETPVKYGASPAKVAQLERQSSTESEESSFSSEEEKPSMDRSRTLIRSVSPRRSASPMRRVQIGRSGSHRSTAITIRSLNNFPIRERPLLPKDSAANDSDEEGSEQAPRKSDNNVRRMSVKDAINLFESKQKDQTVDIHKERSLLNASLAANRSALRRWSSGNREDSSQCPQDLVSEDAVSLIQNNLDIREAAKSSPKTETKPEAEAEPGVASEDHPTEPCGLDANLNSSEKRACSPVVMHEEPLPTESTNTSEKLAVSAEWSRQKEAELNELLMKMMETKPAKSRVVVANSSKRQSLPTEQRSGYYDHYKEKRDEKLRGETARKKAGKDKQFRAMQQILDARKLQLTSTNASDASKKGYVKKLQKSQKNVSQPVNPKTESPKPDILKKRSPRASSLPATRKSWPSMPSPRTTGESPAKTRLASSSTGHNPPHRRSQPAPSVSRPNPKVETSQPPAKSAKPNQNDSKNRLRSASGKKQQSMTKPSKTTKSKAQTGPEDLATSAKPSLYSKVTRKGSVVPLETKPFLRKGSGTISSGNPVVKMKTSSNPEEPLRSSEDPIQTEANEAVSNSCDPVIQPQEREPEELKINMGMESGTAIEIPQKCEDKESSSQANPTIGDQIDRVLEPELLKAGAEVESTISPRAWVEIEEHEDQPLSSNEHIRQTGSPAYAAPVVVSSARVRHSLSQMLLEESSEHDNIDWGNTENPPPTVYQKDAPKGLRRLLKFTRKIKTDVSATGWSSPSVFSEEEDDLEGSKLVSKKGSENLLKKATLQSKNNGHQKDALETYEKNSTDCEHPAQANISKLSSQSLSQLLLDGHVSASVTTTKVSRSFFSLSAFKGGK